MELQGYGTLESDYFTIINPDMPEPTQIPSPPPTQTPSPSPTSEPTETPAPTPPPRPNPGLGSTTANGSGDWTVDSVTIPASVNHTHSITAQAMDTAGNTTSSTGLSLVIDTTDSIVLSKFTAVDRIIVIDTTDPANFTGEGDISTDWNSSTYELTLTDLAGNTTLMSQLVYQGAEGDGLHTAVEDDAVDGETIHICAGTYSLSGNALRIDYSLTLRGDESSTTLIE